MASLIQTRTRSRGWSLKDLGPELQTYQVGAHFEARDEGVLGAPLKILENFFLFQVHMLLKSILTNQSHDGGKEGHFCYHNGISNHLPLTRGAPLVGQLSLYLLNDF